MASREGSTDSRESTVPEGDRPQGLPRDADRYGCSDCSETDSDKLTAHQPKKGQELRALLKVIEESKSDISRQTQLLEEIMKNAVGVWEAASLRKHQVLAHNSSLRHTIVNVMQDGQGPVSRGLSMVASRQAARTSGTAAPAAVEASSRTSSATQAVYSTERSRPSQLASLRASLSITSTEVTQRITSAAFRSEHSSGVPDLRADPGAWFDYWHMVHATSNLTSTALAGLRFQHVFEGLIGSSCCKMSTDKLMAVHACLGVMWYRVGLGQDGKVTRAEFLKPEGLASTIATFFRPRQAAAPTTPLLPGPRQRFPPRAHPPPEVYELVN